MRSYLQHPAKRAGVSLVLSCLMCTAHCALSAYIAPQSLCMPQASANLLLIDPFNVLLGSAFVFSALTALTSLKPAFKTPA